MKSVFLVLMDLSAVFDMVDHKLLLDRISKRLGIGRMVRDWIESYLAGRKQAVLVGDTKSSTQHLLRSDPQGSVLGPIFFTIYTQPVGDIVWKHKMDVHLYADIADIKEWMLQNKLNLNGLKTEFLQCQPHLDNGSGKPMITIGEDSIGTSDNAILEKYKYIFATKWN